MAPPLSLPRPRRRRRALRGVALGVLIVTVAACGSDGGGEAAAPTTTAPELDETTTTTGGTEASTTGDATTATDGSGPVVGDDADVLTVEEASAQLQALLNNYRSALVGIRTRGTVDEVAQRDLGTAYSGRQVSIQISGLADLVPDGLASDPPPLEVGEVDLLSATGTCAAGSVVVPQAGDLFTVTLEITQPLYFKLVPAAEGSPSPGWRLDLLNPSRDGQPLDGATCE